MNNISIIYRNFGHWDFYQTQGEDTSRKFRLRGSGSEWSAVDERKASNGYITFKTFTCALAYITEQLMHEDLEPDGYGNNRPLNGLVSPA